MTTSTKDSLREKALKELKNWDFDVIYQNTISFSEGEGDVLVDVISEGWMGIYQADEILEIFDLDVEEEEEKWDVIDDFSSCLSELITQVMREKYGVEGFYYFSSFSDSGDYGLIYSEEVE